MRKLDIIENALQYFSSALNNTNDIVCIEGPERFEFVDGSHSNMSEKRLKAVLEKIIDNHLSEVCLNAGVNYTPISPKKMLGITTNIVKSIMHRNMVKAAFETMPGWPQGMFTFDGVRYLIRSKIEPTPPAKGKWDELQLFFESLFGCNASDPNYDQQIHAFYCLVRAKYLQMRSNGKNRGSCPLLVMMGDEGSGKTLLMRIVAQLLGQTEVTVDPSADRNGWTDQRLCSSVLFYDEASASAYGFSDGIPRGRFAEEFKRFEYSQAADITSRGKTAVKLPAVWFWARALNPDSPAAIMQTPIPSENGMSEKLILAKIYKGVLPLDGKEDEKSRVARLQIIESQIPAFGHWLLNDFQMRPEWISRKDGSEYRNQAPPFFHPDVLDTLSYSDNDESKSLIVRNFLTTYSALPLDNFSAGELFSHALKASQDTEDPDVNARSFIRIFDSAVKLGRTLSNMAAVGGWGIARVKKGNTNHYSYDKPISVIT
jgi:hypothetical protein